jgi:hypothetical protein
MLSTTVFEKRFFLHKTEGKNVSIQTFCVNNGVNLCILLYRCCLG